MSFQPVPSLITFAPLTTIASSDMNSNLGSLRNTLNNLIVSQDTLAPFTISGTLTIATGANISFKGGSGTVSGVATFSSGWAISGGLMQVTAAGFSGIPTFSSGLAIGAGAILATGVTAAFGTIGGTPTFSSGWSISAGVVSGVATFSSGVTVSSGTMVVSAAGTAAAVAMAIADAGTGLMSPIDSFGLSLVASGVRVLAIGNAVQGGQSVNITGRNLQMVTTGNSIIAQPATLGTSAATGWIYVPTSPGTATSVASPIFGCVALGYDTTNNRLMVYNGGWKTVALT